MLKSITSSTVLDLYLLSVNKAFSALHNLNSVASTCLNYLYSVLLHYSAEYEQIIRPTIWYRSDYTANIWYSPN